MKRVLLVFPTQWDLRQLEFCRADWQDEFEVVTARPGQLEAEWDLDVTAWIEQCVARHRGRIDGVLSSCDYPGAAAAALVAERLGLPGAPPAAVLRSAHKYHSRCTQRSAAPDATPRFELLDPCASRPPALGFPCFVKPVKGQFSLWTKRIEGPGDLQRILGNPGLHRFLAEHTRMFEHLLTPYPELQAGSRALLVEELLGGQLVTLEGFRNRAQLEVVGVVDSTVHPETGSFVRFDLPSRLPSDVLERMSQIAALVVRALGLDRTFFNVEMFWDAPLDRISIVEVNPRMAGQFGDLYARVFGRSSYPDALRLAAGIAPRPRPRAARGCAVSLPLRVFEPVGVRRAPGPDALRGLERELPGDPLLWTEVRSGEGLFDFESEDGASIRYAVANLGAPDRATLEARLARLEQALGFEFEPLARPRAAAG